jgi:hypothetical protein
MAIMNPKSSHMVGEAPYLLSASFIHYQTQNPWTRKEVAEVTAGMDYLPSGLRY